MACRRRHLPRGAATSRTACTRSSVRMALVPNLAMSGYAWLFWPIGPTPASNRLAIVVAVSTMGNRMDVNLRQSISRAPVLRRQLVPQTESSTLVAVKRFRRRADRDFLCFHRFGGGGYDIIAHSARSHPTPTDCLAACTGNSSSLCTRLDGHGCRCARGPIARSPRWRSG